jgi:hypothetical protein
MLLRIPAATLKDLAAYGSLLTSRNAPYQAVITKIGFDHTVAHPKLTFKATRWLTAGEAQQVADTLKADVVEQIIGTKAAPVPEAVAALGAPPEHVKAVSAPAPAPAAPAAPKVTKPKGKPMAEAKVEEKPKPEPSKLSAKIDEASDELDAALAALDDV